MSGKYVFYSSKSCKWRSWILIHVAHNVISSLDETWTCPCRACLPCPTASNLLETFLFLFLFYLYSMDLDIQSTVCLILKGFCQLLMLSLRTITSCALLSIWARAHAPMFLSVCWPGCHSGSKWESPAKHSIRCPQHHDRASLGTKPGLKQSAWQSRPTCACAPAAG